jgi:hypothetical protein
MTGAVEKMSHIIGLVPLADKPVYAGVEIEPHLGDLGIEG